MRRGPRHRSATASKPTPLVRLWRSLLALVLALGFAIGPVAAAPPACASPGAEGAAHGQHALASEAVSELPDGAGPRAGVSLAPDPGEPDECQRDHCQHPTAPAVDAQLRGLLFPRRRRRPPPRGRSLRQAPLRLLERPPRG